jgi:hypothetical protein
VKNKTFKVECFARLTFLDRMELYGLVPPAHSHLWRERGGQPALSTALFDWRHTLVDAVDDLVIGEWRC